MMHDGCPRVYLSLVALAIACFGAQRVGASLEQLIGRAGGSKEGRVYKKRDMIPFFFLIKPKSAGEHIGTYELMVT